MKLENEYSILVLLLHKIVEEPKLSQRRKLESVFIQRLNQFKKHIQQVDEKIDRIADQVAPKKEMSQFEQDYLKYDALMDHYRYVPKLDPESILLTFITKKGDADENRNA